MTNFDKALKFTLKWEGGYVNHPLDKGGPTNRGITQRTLNAAYKAGLVPHCNVKNITRDEAATIYLVNYWQRVYCDILLYPLCVAHFDAAVSNGIGNAGKFLQRTLNLYGKNLAVDGAIGKRTLEAAKIFLQHNPKEDARKYNSFRGKFFNDIVRNNPEQAVFLKGWMRRLNDLRKECEA